MALSDTISKFPDYAEIILKALEQPMDYVKVTDRILCPRQKIFEIVNPKGQSYQAKENTRKGRDIHKQIQRWLKKSFPEVYEIERSVQFKNLIFGSIDVYDKKLDIVIEIKVSPKEKTVNSSWDEKPRTWDVEQLKYLMAMNNTSRGKIILVFPNGMITVKEFDHIMLEGEKKRYLMKLDENAKSFLIAKNSRDPGLAKHVFFDGNLNWLCQRKGEVMCPYFFQCMSMIGKEKGMGDAYYDISSEVERISQKPKEEDNENSEGCP